ncbi:Glycerophosphocholine phosphodiesterase [Rhizophlyctis rosea]|uniref:Glycerophosphocholine phosphodiesterase n=1 Tax=Rhizophlyctis rosea TaxID=64517 RepID=A0AAD5SBA2_9FUNG|nr:Glycerophosphocholine phosphodiesterase [Rhizophlyctis rosea]
MKFGRTLLAYQIPEWARYYLNYKRLKQSIKQAQHALRTSGKDSASVQEAAAGFQDRLLEEVSKVDAFFVHQRQATGNRIALCQTAVDTLIKDAANATEDSLELLREEQIMESLNDIKIKLYLILRFTEANRTAVRKIVKKADKKIEKDYLRTLWPEKVQIACSCYHLPLILTLIFQIATLSFMRDGIFEEYLKKVEALTDRIRSLVSLSIDDSTSPASIESKRFITPSLVTSALMEDDPAALKAALEAERQFRPNNGGVVTSQILYRAVVRHAQRCLPYLLANAPPLDIPLPDDVHKRNVLHKLIVKAGSPSTPASQTALGRFSDEDGMVLGLLQLVPADVAERTITSKDLLRRTPLHYATLFGLTKVAEELLQFLPRGALDQHGWTDDDGHTPVFYAIVKGHADIVDLFLNSGWTGRNGLGDEPAGATLDQTAAFKKMDSLGDLTTTFSAVSAETPRPSAFRPLSQQLGPPLALACTYGHVKIVQSLLEHGIDPNAPNSDGETPLHLCARHGHLECLTLLVNGGGGSAPWKKADVNAEDLAYRRTPIFLAATDGHLECVRVLLESSADVKRSDTVGFNPHEYAVLYGHRDVAALLRPHTPQYPSDSSTTKLTSDAQAALVERAYGHNCLVNRSMIQVHLGSLDSRVQVAPIQLDERYAPASTGVGTYVLSLSARGAEGQTKLFELPLITSVVEPVQFYATDFKNVTLEFEVRPAYLADKRTQVVGKASVLLSTAKTSLWQERTPLGGSIEAPIVAAGSLDIIGRVLFEFIVIKPFVHRNFEASGGRVWKQITTKVVGHRGLGMNKAAQVDSNKGHLTLGENTLLSFITAGALGAEYVEFDLVPVLYHDFTVWETGYPIPVSMLTLRQFLSLHPNEAPATNYGRQGLERVRRSKSLTGPLNMMRRMSVTQAPTQTSAWPTKGNAEGTIQLPHATLEEALKKVPEKVGFNIEVKYPNLEEAEMEDLHSIEINVFVDKILEVVFEQAKGRNIYFSSFHPEVCWMLSLKQNQYPVFFLTEGGSSSTYDVRCNSLIEAARFASRSGCLGIVTQVAPIIEAPNLVRAIRESGLLLFTYGSMNNLVENVKLQKAYGVDAVIVDKVRQVVDAFGGVEGFVGQPCGQIPVWLDDFFRLNASTLQQPTLKQYVLICCGIPSRKMHVYKNNQQDDAIESHDRKMSEVDESCNIYVRLYNDLVALFGLTALLNARGKQYGIDCGFFDWTFQTINREQAAHVESIVNAIFKPYRVGNHSEHLQIAGVALYFKKSKDAREEIGRALFCMLVAHAHKSYRTFREGLAPFGRKHTLRALPSVRAQLLQGDGNSDPIPTNLQLVSEATNLTINDLPEYSELFPEEAAWFRRSITGDDSSSSNGDLQLRIECEREQTKREREREQTERMRIEASTQNKTMICDMFRNNKLSFEQFQSLLQQERESINHPSRAHVLEVIIQDDEDLPIIAIVKTSRDMSHERKDKETEDKESERQRNERQRSESQKKIDKTNYKTAQITQHDRDIVDEFCQSFMVEDEGRFGAKWGEAFEKFCKWRENEQKQITSNKAFVLYTAGIPYNLTPLY